jgi:hypothetical protein
VGDLPVDLLGQSRLDGQQRVHRLVAGLVAGLAQPVDVHVVSDPVGRCELAGGLERTVGDQGEQDPLHAVGVDAPAGQRRADRGADAQSPPQPVEGVGAAHRPGIGEAISAGPARAAAAAGSSSLVSAATRRWIAGRSISSSRPNECRTFARDTPAWESHSLWASCK